MAKLAASTAFLALLVTAGCGGAAPGESEGDLETSVGSVGDSGVLRANEALAPGEALASCNGAARLAHQSDGNVVVYDGLGALWATGTNGQASSELIMQSDGNLVLYGPNAKPLWNSETWGHPGAYAALQDDCHLVVYGPDDAPLWQSARLCGQHLYFTALGVSDGNVPYQTAKAAPVLDQIGANASMVWLWWSEGQTELTADQEAYVAASNTLGRPVIAILTSHYNGGVHPRTAARRSDFCATIQDLATQPGIYAVQVGNEPNLAGFFGLQANAPADYVRLARECYPAIKSANAGVVVVGPSLAASHAPGAFIQGMGSFYKALPSGDRTVLFDVWGHHPYPLTGGEAPEKVHPGAHLGMGDIADLRNAIDGAFGGTVQGGAAKRPIWYTETGVTHEGGKPVVIANPAPIDWYERAYHLAACQAGVKGFFSFQLFDDADGAGAWQSGMLHADWTPKGDLGRIGAAANAARAQTVDCSQFSNAVK